MTEHYTRNTTGIMKWCNRCGKNTMHKVSGKKVGLCTENHHIEKPIQNKPEEEPRLF